MRFYPDHIPAFPGEPTSDRFEIAVLDGTRGEGVRARVPFRRGEVVFHFAGEIVVDRTLHSLQLPDGRHLHDPWFMGKVLHACDPNCTVDMRARAFTALRDIAAGELITMHYGETEDVLFRAFQCRCGSPRCVGWVAGRSAPPDRPR